MGEAYAPNINPQIAASYFIRRVSCIGPEDSCRQQEQNSFRKNPDVFFQETMQEKRVLWLYGRSTANSRIGGALIIVNLFQTFLDDGHFTGQKSNPGVKLKSH